MGHRELIESLRNEGEENINQLWAEVKGEAENINADTDRRIKELREEYRKREEIEAKKYVESIFSQARNRARIIRLSAVKLISDRFFPLARASLPELRNSRYQEVFSSLVDELPDLAWEEVFVSPQDSSVAMKRFPDARTTADDSISGGLKAMGDNGKIYVDNTLEKRLEIAWEDILPKLIKSICTEVSSDESAVSS